MNKTTTSQMETYRIRAAGEWATIALEGWRDCAGHEQGELMVHSSFGTWAHRWVNTGAPFVAFLLAAKRNSMTAKLLGVHALEFDFDASVAGWKPHLVEARRSRQITGDEFEYAWDLTCRGVPCSLEMFLWRIQWAEPQQGGRELRAWADPERHAMFREHQQFSAFWTQLWPLFLQQLRQRSPAANDCQHERTVTA